MATKEYLEALKIIYEEDEVFKSLGRLSNISPISEGIAKAQMRAQQAAQRHQLEDLQLYQQQQMAQSRALQNVASPPYVIGATSRDQGSSTMDPSSNNFREFQEFHSQMERTRGESKQSIDYRYVVARATIVYMVTTLIWELLK